MWKRTLRLDVDLNAFEHLVRVGHRLRVHFVCSSDAAVEEFSHLLAFARQLVLAQLIFEVLPGARGAARGVVARSGLRQQRAALLRGLLLLPNSLFLFFLLLNSTDTNVE